MSKKLPVVAIVGRQNVGKSTLFNALIKDKKAIVDSHPGLTRDIICYQLTYNDKSFVLSDTPGLDLPPTAELSVAILNNAKKHLSEADCIILLMENPTPTTFDEELAAFIRKLNKPTVVAVNKMDYNEQLIELSNFYKLGFNEILPISAVKRRNLTMLLDMVTNELPNVNPEKKEPDLKIAIVGRPNAGKSTLMNSFLGYERSIVSSIAGTTRDAIDEDFIFDGKVVRLVDTAGIRKQSKIKSDIEFYSLTRTREAIARSEVIIHLIDASIGLSENDKKIADEILKAKKPFILAINKWDLLEKNEKSFKEYSENIIYNFYRADDFPIISISASTKQRIHKLLLSTFDLKVKANRHITTAELNKLLMSLQKKQRLPLLGETMKIYYATQINSSIPEFKLFVNNTDLFRRDAVRYLQKEIQKAFDLKGVPVYLVLDGRIQKKREAERKKK